MKLITTLHCLLIVFVCTAQTAVQEISNTNPPQVALAPLRFLASDELMGRSTTRPEVHIAARYISEEFRSLGLREVAGTKDYFQSFTINMFAPSKTGTVTVNSKTYSAGDDFLQISGTDVTLTAPVVYAGFGMKDDLDGKDVKGKIIAAEWGAAGSSSFYDGFNGLSAKVKAAKEKGAQALLVRSPRKMPWQDVQQYLLPEYVQEEGMDNFNVFLITGKDSLLPSVKQNQLVAISVTGSEKRNVPAENVMGWVEGTDAKLKDQFVVLSAHYDHIGVAKQPRMEEGKPDSIYNGARDNAIGATAVIDAARYFSKHPPRRSMLFITFTGEEMGLIGSRYFAAHPALPLRQLVYDLNIDNASYNDTTIITFVGLGRTSADADVKKACAAYGLSVLPDPTAEQWLFSGSDNIALAQKGIPAPTFSLGMRSFDSTIFNRYHQLSDEVGNFNLNYAIRFINAFVLSAKYIADNDRTPAWIKGDKYEAAWKTLHQ